MIRWVRCAVVMVWIVVSFGGVWAQETPTPLPPAVELPQEILLRAERAVERAEQSAALAEETLNQANEAVSRANESIGLASDLFGLFEAMSSVVGLVLPALALAAGFIGFRRLESAQDELREARERFEKEIRQRELELDQLRDQLIARTDEQRRMAAQASSALGLLPLGERQYRAQDYQGAIETYKRAQELDPGNQIIYYRIAYVYTQSGNLDEAEIYLQKSLEIDPNFALTLALRPYILRRRADKMPPGLDKDLLYSQAVEGFLQVLKHSPKLVDEDGESWYGALGGLYRRQGMIEQAIDAYTRATKVTPYSSYPFGNLALLYAITKNHAEMLEAYRRVEQIAQAEVYAEVGNYWAYADLIVARLALGKEVGDYMPTMMAMVPLDSPYVVESLRDTLTRLMEVIEPKKHGSIVEVINGLNMFETHLKSMSAT